MKSIRWKLVIMYIALVFIVMLISGTFMIFSLREREKVNANSELKEYALAIREFVIEPIFPRDIDTSVSDPNTDTFQEALNNDKSRDSQIHGSIIKISPYSRITIATTTTDDIKRFPQHNSTVVISAVNGVPKFDYNRMREDINSGIIKPCYEYAMPYQTDDGVVNLIIYVWKDATLSNENLTQITNIFAVSVVIALVFTAILGVLFASSLTIPLSNLSHRAKELAKGDLNQRIDVSTKDEIGQLNESFNYMAFALSNIMSDIEREKSKMEIILNNMTDGVLAYDDKGRLIHANYVCSRILEISKLEEVRFSDILKLLKINTANTSLPAETPENVLCNLVPSNARDSVITIGDKYINVLFNIYKSKDGMANGIVIVLQDITKHMKLDNMRKEFVANVSHELRTPLTTIKGYTETLIDGGIEDTALSADFLRIIVNEADRMTNIVMDLLELSRFDNKQLDFNFSETNLVDVVNLTVKQNIVTAEKLNKSIVFETPLSPMPVVIDSGRVNQVINNIITNALKYSNEFAAVKIFTEETEGYYKIYIQDNGLGIPKEDINRIFERFYRVDKARSRELGGTGLGLSIAKEIMEAHKGNISCSSELGVGTTMVLSFLKNLTYPLQDDDAAGNYNKSN